MIVEYIRYKIARADTATFELDYARAAKSLEASEHCRACELSCCLEEPGNYILRIEWDSLAGHMQGFRASENFTSFFAAIKPYVDRIAELRHYKRTAVKNAKIS